MPEVGRLTFRKARKTDDELSRWSVYEDGVIIGLVGKTYAGIWRGAGPRFSDIRTETRYEAAHWMATRLKRDA